MGGFHPRVAVAAGQAVDRGAERGRGGERQRRVGRGLADHGPAVGAVRAVAETWRVGGQEPPRLLGMLGAGHRSPSPKWGPAAASNITWLKPMPGKSRPDRDGHEPPTSRELARETLPGSEYS